MKFSAAISLHFYLPEKYLCVFVPSIYSWSVFYEGRTLGTYCFPLSVWNIFLSFGLPPFSWEVTWEKSFCFMAMCLFLVAFEDFLFLLLLFFWVFVFFFGVVCFWSHWIQRKRMYLFQMNTLGLFCYWFFYMLNVFCHDRVYIQQILNESKLNSTLNDSYYLYSIYY